MTRWTESAVRSVQNKRQGRAEANHEARQHIKDAPRAKYRSKKTQVDGITFDSKAEAERYVQLKRLQEADVISGLKCQVPFDLSVNGEKICRYIADFVYLDVDGARVVEDVKGFRTKEYQLKKKLMHAIHRIAIKEVTKEKARRPRV